MRLSLSLRAALALCMSCALGACLAEPSETKPEETTTAEPSAASTGEVEEAASVEATAKAGGDGSDLLGCGGSQNWCLIRCSKSGSALIPLGPWGQFGGDCAAAGEAYCTSHKLGYRTFACWGHL